MPRRLSPSRLLVLAALAAGCARSPRAAGDAPAAAVESAADAFSVYDLGSRWHDQRGGERALASLAGRPQVVAMVYTHCAATCPLTVAALRRIERESSADVGLVLVSLDPGRDTPARLAAYAAEHGLVSERWTLLSGSDADVRDLAAALGVRYRRVSSDEVAHANALTLLDRRGAVVRQQPGTAPSDADEIVRALRANGS